MTAEAYARLCDAIRLIRVRIAESWQEPDEFVDSWAHWAEVFVSGLYVGRWTDRVLECARRDGSRPTDRERLLLARAAALAVEATREAVRGDEKKAMLILDDVRQLAEQSGWIACSTRSLPGRRSGIPDDDHPVETE